MEHGTDTAQGRRRLAQLVGCLLLLSAFLGILLLFFFQFRTAALQSITVANESFGNYVDSVLTLSNANIRTSAMQVFYTSSIRTLRTSGDLTWPERTIGHRDLGNFVSSSIFIDNIMIYNGNLDMVFTSESGFSSAPSAQFHDPEAAQLLRFPQQHSYLAPFKRQVGDTAHYSFLFFADGSSGFSSMLLDINADWYEAQLLGTLPKDRHVIVDAACSPLIPEDSAMRLPPLPLFQKALRSAPNSGYVLPGDSLLLSSCWVYHKLGQTGWYYLEAFELADDVPGLARVQQVVTVVFVLVFLAALLLFFYLIFSIFPTFFYISRALDAVGTERKKYTEKFDELVSDHRAYKSNRVLQELRAGLFPADTPLPVTLLALPDGLSEALPQLGEIAGYTSVPFEQGELLILPGCTSKTRNRLLSAIQDLSPAAPVFALLPCYTSEQLLEAFDALSELRQLAFLYPSQPLLRQELLSECNESSGLQRDIVDAIESSLKKGQLDVAQAQWLLLFNSIRKDRFRDFRFAVHYVDRMLFVLAAEYGLDCSGTVDEALTDLAALQSYIDSRFKAITDAVNAQQQEAAESLSRTVWDKIYALYHDENCCCQMIAEQLGVSSAHLNRQFRSVAGMSVGDAIQYVRIDKVCKLLSQSELPIEQIARQVGYSNTKYFFVLFKKRIGMTPAQFRSDLTQQTPPLPAPEGGAAAKT